MIEDKDLLDPGYSLVYLTDALGRPTGVCQTFCGFARDSHTEELKVVTRDAVDDWWISDLDAFLADWAIFPYDRKCPQCKHPLSYDDGAYYCDCTHGETFGCVCTFALVRWPTV